MSFFSKFFSCCSTSESDQKYLVKTANGETSVYNSLDEIDKNIKENKDTQITKIKTQAGLQTKKQQLKEKNSNFIDGQFLHDNNSIGKQHSTQIQWKRIPELLPANVTPVIFDSKIQPSDVITGHEGDCYFLSSLAALAQSPKTIRQIFKDQTYNKQGIYHLNLRNHGVIEEVVIDDYIPVDENGTPLYCQPNARTGQFWVVLVQKAIAKTKGSYQELEVGTPSQIFRAVGHAPAQSIVFSNTSEQKERIWATLLENNNKNNPICATTVNNASHHTNLQNSHTYTVVKAIQFHNEHHSQRVIKIRNPWKQINYNGKASSEDNTFWNSIHAQNKQEFLSFNNGSAYGLATIHLDDFIANFNQIHISNTNGGGKYLTQPLSFSDKKGKYFEIDVDREGSFTFELNQSKVHNKKLQPTFQSNSNPHQQNHQHQNEVEQIHIESEVEHKLASLNELRHTNQPQQEVFNQQLIPNQAHNNNQQQNNPNEQRCGRSTLMIFQKDRMSNNYKFVNGIMKYNQQNTTLTEHLSPGTYVIYSKIDHIVKSNRVPQNACLSLYSTNYANLRVASPSAHINLFHNAFLNHAENNKKIEQSQGKVWISYQLLFQKGGYAYFAVGNAKDNNQAVVVNFNPAYDFDSLNFYLKQPHKNITQTVMRILPGQKQIIIAKVKNDPNITSAKFPPKLDIKLEPLFNKNI